MKPSMMSLSIFFDKLNKFSLYLLFFLMPVFFLPFTQNGLDLPKQLLALILVFLSLIGLLGKAMLEKEVVFRGKKIIYISLVLILFSLLLSSIFSIWPTISFWGNFPNVSDSFLSYFICLILLIVLINSFRDKSDVLPLIFIFLLSGAIAAFLNLFQIYKIYLLPFDFTKTQAFNTVGTPIALAFFLVFLLPLSLILIFETKKILKIIFIIISLLLLLNIILINLKIIWFSLILVIFFLFVFGFENQKERIKIGWLVSLMIGLILAIFFYFFPNQFLNFPSLPPEVYLNVNSEIYILKGSFSEGIKNIILGSGPSTFIFEYSKYRPALLNQTIFWGTRFSNGQSFLLDWLLTKGILGMLSLLFFYFLIIFFIFKNLKEKDDLYGIKLGLSTGIIILFLASFLHPFNFLLSFTLFFFIGVFIVFVFKPIKTEPSFSKRILLNTSFILTIFLGLSLFLIQGQKYLAEVNYLKGINNFQKGDIDNAINYVQKAINFNSSGDGYFRDLAQFYLTKANLVSANKDLSQEEKRKLVTLVINRGVDAINMAVKIAPFNVSNWNVRGFFYRNLIGIEGVADRALESYLKAIELEPTSPFAYGEKARVHILMAQDFAQKGEEKLKEENLNFALKDLEKALKLKPDYAPCHYLLAVVYDQKGDLEKAILKLEETKTIASQDVGIGFQLGLLYWRKGEIEKAQREFENVLKLDPKYSNARYMLGLVYEKKGEKERVKEEFKKVFELNPNNQEVKKILENLERNLPALEGIVPNQPPIQETPSEISPIK